MLSKDQSQQSSPLRDAKAGTEVPLMDPDKTIDGAAGGGGGTDDPGASDHKPPAGIAGLEKFA
jgi:hypothetical protein